MARDRASIRIDMWGDGDWRDLPRGPQHLYMLLLSHPKLTYAGVTEWHPGKLAAMTHGSDAAEIVAFGAVLESRGFIVVEPSTDEVLIRSFIKHDGLMKQPKLVVSMTTAYAAVASRRLQLVIADEVQKMRDREPEMRAWQVKQVQTVLDARASRWEEVGPALTPDVTPGLTPEVPQSGGESVAEPTTTATATSSKEDRSTANRGTRIPEDFAIDQGMREWAEVNAPNVDLDDDLPSFMDYWRGVAGAKGVKRDWVSTWRNHARRQQHFAAQQLAQRPPARSNAWMDRSTR